MKHSQSHIGHRILNGPLQPLADCLWTAYSFHLRRHIESSDNIVVAGTGRGGSTWLAEVVATLPQYLLYWEPLHPYSNERCLDLGFRWHNYLLENASFTTRQLEYLYQVFEGRQASARFLKSHHLSFGDLVRPAGMIVKFVNANMILHRIAEHFNVRILLLVRHPCAVVASQLHHGAWDAVDRSNPDVQADMRRICADYPRLEKLWEEIESREEVLAFIWAVETKIPLSHADDRDWHLIFYEDLVRNGRNEVDRMFDALGEPVPDSAYSRLHVPSSTTAQDSNVAAGKDPLRTWRSRLDADQVNQILRVTHRAGLDFYTDALTPMDRSFDTP